MFIFSYYECKNHLLIHFLYKSNNALSSIIEIFKLYIIMNKTELNF